MPVIVLLALTAQYAEQGLWNGTVSVRSAVRLSVFLSQHRPTAANPLLQVCCCAEARWAGDIDWLLHGRRSATAAGESGQCHVVSVRKKLNPDLLYLKLFRTSRAILVSASVPLIVNSNSWAYCMGLTVYLRPRTCYSATKCGLQKVLSDKGKMLCNMCSPRCSIEPFTLATCSPTCTGTRPRMCMRFTSHCAACNFEFNFKLTGKVTLSLPHGIRHNRP